MEIYYLKISNARFSDEQHKILCVFERQIRPLHTYVQEYIKRSFILRKHCEEKFTVVKKIIQFISERLRFTDFD